MPGERLVFDARTESSTNAPLELVERDAADVAGITLLEHAYPTPDPETLTAGGADTEGDPLIQNRYPNRQIPLSLRVSEPPGLAAATNGMKYPRAELTTANWTSFLPGGGGDMTNPTPMYRDSAWAKRGDYAARLMLTKGAAAANAAWRVKPNTSALADYMAVAPGDLVAGAMDVYVWQAPDDPARGIQAVITWRNAAGGLISESSGALNRSTGEQRLTVSGTAPALAAYADLTWQVQTAIPGDVVEVSLDGFVAVKGSLTIPDYFDGDTPGCAWTGTALASQSTRPASDGPRFYAILGDLQKKIDRINREGGTLKRIPDNGSPIVFDLLRATITNTNDRRFIHGKRTDVEIQLTAKPFGRGATEVVGANNDESTLPALRFLTTGVPGDVPALGRLIVTERQAVDQWRVIWGQRSRYYDASADAALFYEAEGRTILVGSSGAVAGASGGNAVTSTLAGTNFAALLSTRATGGGNYLTHRGAYRVIVRYRTTAANAEIAFDYAEGDLTKRIRTTKTARPSGVNSWELADLGVVRLAGGRWDGRVLGRRTDSSGGASAVIDCLFLVPVDEGAGEIYGKPVTAAPSAYSGADSFPDAAGPVLGTAADTGGNWAAVGAANDFAYTGGGAIQRTAVGDGAGVGRIQYLPNVLTNTIVSVDFQASVAGALNQQGVAARVASAAALIRFAYVWSPSVPRLNADIQGGVTGGASAQAPVLIPGTWYTLTAYVDTTGRYFAWLNRQGAALGDPILSGFDTALATAGALASGWAGIADYQSGPTAVTRLYDNFAAWAPPLDAAVFANREAQVRHDRVQHQDAAGGVSGPVTYDGDFLLVPPAGPENRTSEIIVKGSRGRPGDPAIDDLRAALAYTPRYLVVPG